MSGIFDLSTTASSNTAIAGINIAELCLASGINNAIRELCAEVKGALVSVPATGTDTITCTVTPAPLAYVDGMVLFVRAAGANATTVPTINANSLGAITITKFGGTALVAGDIAGANHEMILRYNSGATKFELLNPKISPASVLSVTDATNGGVTATTTAGAVTLALNPSDLLTKSAPTSSDSVIIEDAAASNAAKTATIPNLRNALGLYAWGNIGSTGTVNAGFNVSSVSHGGTGNYTIHFTNALPDANYAVAGVVINGTPAAFEISSLTTTTFILSLFTVAGPPVAADSAFTFMVLR